jgi:antitoxin CptB
MTPPRSDLRSPPPRGGDASRPAEPDLQRPLGGERGEGLLGERALSKLKWRCRRGLLENDLFVERFFREHEATLTTRQADALAALMELPDNDLLDLTLRRSEPHGALDRPDVREVLALLRRPLLTET